MKPDLFWLGSHRHYHLAHTPVPLCISNNTLGDGKPEGRRTLPVRVKAETGEPAPWVLDSGGFTQLQTRGSWDEGPSPEQYVRLLRRYREEIGGLTWAAPQDWMCEPPIINGGWWDGKYYVGTHLSVPEHLRLTVLNGARLRELDSGVILAVQGWEEDHYARCVDLYWQLVRIDLTAEPLVLVGSLCRRQNTAEAGRILKRLHRCGVTRLHGLGFKLDGILDHGDLLASSDSQAWSRGARYGDHQHMRLPGCTHRGPKHANCLAYALWWRENKVLPVIGRSSRSFRQLDLFDLDVLGGDAA